MPRAKKQKTRQDSGASAQDPDGHSSDSAFESVHPPKRNKSNKAKSNHDNSENANESSEDEERPEPYSYVCFHRPLFDVENENWLKWSSNPDAHVEKAKIYDELYKPIWDKENEAGIPGKPAEMHPEHKWVMMWDGWIKMKWLSRKARYCDPDNLNMILYNDWKSWGVTEILENMMVEFNDAYRSKGPNRLEKMWVIISAVGYWFSQTDDFGSFIMSEDGDSVEELIGVMGSAVLTTLTAIEKAGELKPDSRFRDLALVIGYYLEFSWDLPAYGFEGGSVSWRKRLVEYFKEANLDPAKALVTTKQRMEKIEKGDKDWYEEEEQDETTKDSEKENANPYSTKGKPQSPKSATGKRKRGSTGGKSGASKDAKKEEDKWRWDELFKKYKKRHDPVMGGHQYDITKMSRAERRSAAMDGKDPFAGIPAKELKEDLIDFE